MRPLFRLKPGISLTLASASPRREELLASSGLAFRIFPSPAPEPEPRREEAPEIYSRRCASAKGRACLKFIPDPNVIIVAADTIVCLDDQILGKPRDEADALRMLKILNGREHAVFTSVWTRLPPYGKKNIFTVKSLVRFASWSDAVLAAYASLGESLDKAGAYAVQGVGSFLAAAIEGSWTNVKGLPLSELLNLLLAKKLIAPALTQAPLL